MKLLVVKITKVDDKAIWGVMRSEGFKYVGSRVMVKLVMNSRADIYKEYIKSLIEDYGEGDIKEMEI